MIDQWTPPPLRLPEGIYWTKDLTLFESTNNLDYLQGNDPDEFDKFLVPELSLENVAPMKWEGKATVSKKEDPERAEELRRKKSNRRGAMRGITMELLVGSSLRHWDKPADVIANVTIKNDKPSTAAQGRKTDVVADYPGNAEFRGFRIHAEVSSKETMNRTDFKTQMDSAWKHAYAAIEESPDLLIYCLLVNNGRIYKDKNLHNDYLDFIRIRSSETEDNIRMLPMYTADFVTISGSIWTEIPREKRYFESEVLSAALNAVYSQVVEYDLPEERNWMSDLFMEEVKRWLGDNGDDGLEPV